MDPFPQIKSWDSRVMDSPISMRKTKFITAASFSYWKLGNITRRWKSINHQFKNTPKIMEIWKYRNIIQSCPRSSRGLSLCLREIVPFVHPPLTPTSSPNSKKCKNTYSKPQTSSKASSECKPCTQTNIPNRCPHRSLWRRKDKKR